MKLATYVRAEAGTSVTTIGAVLADDRLLDLPAAEPRIPADMVALLRSAPTVLELARVATETAEQGGYEAHVQPVAACRLLTPIPQPGKFLHTGFNFRRHLAETGRQLPTGVVGAARFASSIIGPSDPIIYPPSTEALDLEAEVVIVIGTRCRDIDPAESLEVVAGYTLYNDLTARDIQLDEARGGILLAKNLPGTNAIGPWIVTADEISDPDAIDFEGWVNDECLQRGNTRDMIFTVAEIVSFFSRFGLAPGDLISTGTCEGAGAFRQNPDQYFLKPGMVASIRSPQLGTLENTVVAA